MARRLATSHRPDQIQPSSERAIMMNRLTDTAAILGLLFLIWLFATRFHVLFDTAVCWTSCP